VSQYQKGKTNLDFTEARDREWQWHQLGHMQVCTSLLTKKPRRYLTTHFLQTGCPSCHPTNSVKALKTIIEIIIRHYRNATFTLLFSALTGLYCVSEQFLNGTAARYIEII